MVGVGEMLAAAVVKEVVGKLLAVASAAARGPVKTMWRFKDDLEEMTKTLKFVEAGIRDAERRSVKDEVARLWLKRLKKAAYDISDMFEEFEANSPPRIWSKAFMAYGLQDKSMKNTNMILKAAYNVGGHSVNSEIIQNSILGCQSHRPSLESTFVVRSTGYSCAVDNDLLISSVIAWFRALRVRSQDRQS